MEETTREIKSVVWVGSSHRDLKEFSSDVQDEVGYALYIAQLGDKHSKVKHLKGFSGVMEIRSDFATIPIDQYTLPKSETLFTCYTLFKRNPKEVLKHLKRD